MELAGLEPEVSLAGERHRRFAVRRIADRRTPFEPRLARWSAGLGLIAGATGCHRLQRGAGSGPEETAHSRRPSA